MFNIIRDQTSLVGLEGEIDEETYQMSLPPTKMLELLLKSRLIEEQKSE